MLVDAEMLARENARLSDEARRDLLEVLEDRYALRATVMTSQLDPKRWHDHLAAPGAAQSDG